METTHAFAGRIVKQVISRIDVSREDVEKLFRLLLDHKLGDANETTFGAFFAALQTKGPTVDEILGLTDTVLSYDRIEIPYSGNVDSLCGIVGSGKDDLKTFNVSTASAVVAAACGVKVVKNGSRSESSIAGTTDVLEKLGFPINLDHNDVVSLLEKTDFTFCDAEPYFPRMGREYVGKFLFAHPLSYTLSIASGLRFGRIVFGVSFDETELVADVVAQLGFSTFLVVAGHDANGKSLDEVSTLGPTKVTQCIKGKKKTYTLNPKQLGIPVSSYKEVAQGKSVEENKHIFLDVLNGRRTDGARDIVTANTAALLLIAEKVESWQEGILVAREAINSGAAAQKFSHILAVSNTL